MNNLHFLSFPPVLQSIGPDPHLRKSRSTYGNLIGSSHLQRLHRGKTGWTQHRHDPLLRHKNVSKLAVKLKAEKESLRCFVDMGPVFKDYQRILK